MLTVSPMFLNFPDQYAPKLLFVDSSEHFSFSPYRGMNSARDRHKYPARCHVKLQKALPTASGDSMRIGGWLKYLPTLTESNS